MSSGRLAALVGAASVVLLAGCVGSSDIEVDYVGSYTAEVQACAWMATSAQLRQDSGVPSSIRLVDLRAEGAGTGARVSGTTLVGDGGEKKYDWKCSVARPSETELFARIMEFTLDESP